MRFYGVILIIYISHMATLHTCHTCWSLPSFSRLPGCLLAVAVLAATVGPSERASECSYGLVFRKWKLARRPRIADATTEQCVSWPRTSGDRGRRCFLSLVRGCYTQMPNYLKYSIRAATVCSTICRCRHIVCRV